MRQHPKGFFVRHFGLRGVALFEALKGGAAILVALWVLTLRHKDLEEVAAHILRVIHLGPEHNSARWLLRTAGRITGKQLGIVVIGILVYAVIRFTEATGLWLEREWAEWFALLSGGLYLPWEVFELIRHPTLFKWGVLGINILIVLYMAWLLIDSYRRRKAAMELDV